MYDVVCSILPTIRTRRDDHVMILRIRSLISKKNKLRGRSLTWCLLVYYVAYK